MDTDADIRTWWTRPRAWRRPAQANERFWVEEEVLVLRGAVLVDQLSWSEPLDDTERERYDAALTLKAELLQRQGHLNV
jgi:hypothetical protein